MLSPLSLCCFSWSWRSCSCFSLVLSLLWLRFSCSTLSSLARFPFHDSQVLDVLFPLLRKFFANLTSQDIEDLGVVKPLHKKRIELEVASLKEERPVQSYNVVVSTGGVTSEMQTSNKSSREDAGSSTLTPDPRKTKKDYTLASTWTFLLPF